MKPRNLRLASPTVHGSWCFVDKQICLSGPINFQPWQPIRQAAPCKLDDRDAAVTRLMRARRCSWQLSLSPLFHEGEFHPALFKGYSIRCRANFLDPSP